MIAKYPPMGWNSWDCFGAAVNEEQVKQNADYIAKNLKQYGWEYIVVDIQWYQPTATTHEYEPFSELVMDEYGRLQPAVNRFPSSKDGKGFAPLAKYVHDLGLKFGIHIMRGIPRMAAHKHLPILGTDYNADQVANPNSICGWNPDMYGLKCEQMEEGARAYYESIFRLYAEWGVDYVKVDDIAREYPHCKREIELISEARLASGRDIVLSLSPGPAPLEQAEHLKQYANMWRITDDFWDEWKLLLAMFERAEKWCTHSGPGHWPDADMLPVGALRQDYDTSDWTKFTEDEQITMMSLWVMMRAPLIIGGHMPSNDEFTLNLLSNKDILDITKTTWGGHQLYRTEDEIVWTCYSKDSDATYVAFFNISGKARTISLDKAEYDLENYKKVTELWEHKAISARSCIKAKVNAHGAKVFKCEK